MSDPTARPPAEETHPAEPEAASPTETARTGRRFLIVPILVVVLLVAGLVVAITGTMARNDADHQAQVATEQLSTSTSANQDAKTALATAQTHADELQRQLDSDTREANRVLGIANAVVPIGDQLCDCDRRIANANDQIMAAAAAGNRAAFDQAVKAEAAAIDEGNNALQAYDAAIAGL